MTAYSYSRSEAFWENMKVLTLLRHSLMTATGIFFLLSFYI